MTVSTTTSAAQFDPNGVTINFPFAFRFFAATDLKVFWQKPDGTIQLLVLNSNYTVQGAGNDAGGSITTIGTPLPNGLLVVSRIMVATQLTSFRNQGEFFAEIHEDAFDKLVMLVQQTIDSQSRGLTVPLADPLSLDLELPGAVSRSGKILTFDEIGQPVSSNLSLAQIEQQPALALESAVAAADSASAAELSETAAATSKALAQKWAENPEDSAVVPGSYSAFHWSRKALASAIAAAAAAFSVKWAASNLKLSATGTSALVQITADEVNLTSALNASFIARSVNISLNIAAGIGAGGLDSGTLTAATRYYVWLVATAAGNVQGIISKSSTAPTMPPTYVYSARVGSIYTAASGSIFPLSFIKAGKNVQLKVAAGSNLASLPSIASGTTPGTYSAAPVSPVVPLTAVAIDVVVYSPNVNGLIVGVAPNASYSTSNTSSNFAPVSLTSPGNAAVPISVKARLLLESANLYYLSNFASATVLVAGWEEDY